MEGFSVVKSGALARRKMKKQANSSQLIQEEIGFHMGISADLPDAARQAANMVYNNYCRWLEFEHDDTSVEYKKNYFTIAVGGGNTVKAEYRALLKHYHSSIDWAEHVRFFFLEESSGEKQWESSKDVLVKEFLTPLASKHFSLSLPRAEQFIESLIHPINLVEVKRAQRGNNRTLAKKLAQRESARYQRTIKKMLGTKMAFHMIISGIGKDGCVGALTPYTPILKNKRPGTAVLEQENGSFRVALNRGVFINADCVSLIVSGNLKLKALGRFEMEEATDFEQTVLETPLRMLRETKEIAQKVYIFADEKSLHVDETVFKYRLHGDEIEIKAETRPGEEHGGIHILMMHGFMGLFSYTSLLLRLPSAWTVSALHRGSHAKNLPDDEIFDHYALSLRKVILKNWRSGQATPIVGHSIAGVIADHLLLSIIGTHDGLIPPYEKLNREDSQLVDALQAGGIINLATWTPTDGVNTGKNVGNLISHLRHDTKLDYSGFKQVYTRNFEDQLQPHELTAPMDSDALARLGNFLKIPGAKYFVNAINAITRTLLKNKKVQQKMLNTNSPYVLRLIGGRLLKKISFYGMLKEVNAALHNPREYQARHLMALDIIAAYDIPTLSMVHADDFLVSATRHREEHEYLLAKRLKKEGVSKEQDLKVAARYILLEREQEELPVDLLNPHLLVMSTSNDGNRIIREITSAITTFVNQNVARAIESGQLEKLTSVDKWLKGNRSSRRRKRTG